MHCSHFYRAKCTAGLHSLICAAFQLVVKLVKECLIDAGRQGDANAARLQALHATINSKIQHSAAQRRLAKPLMCSAAWHLMVKLVKECLDATCPMQSTMSIYCITAMESDSQAY